jgi:hypothetical protein
MTKNGTQAAKTVSYEDKSVRLCAGELVFTSAESVDDFIERLFVARQKAFPDAIPYYTNQDASRAFYGFYAGDGQWLRNSYGQRIACESQAMANQRLQHEQRSGEWHDLIVMAFFAPQSTIALL